MSKRYWKFRLIQMHFSNPSVFTPFRRDKAGFGFSLKARKLFFTAKAPSTPVLRSSTAEGGPSSEKEKFEISAFSAPWR
jgi:hypothetical protein